MLQDWINANLGKIQLTPDPPNGINGECVNAAGSFSMFQGGPQFFGSGNDDTAYDIWLTFNHPFYQRVTGNYTTGDIIFYAPNNSGAGTGPDGHVNVFLRGGTGKGFDAAEANWNGNRGLAINNHSLSGVVGAFRPQGGDMATQQQYDDMVRLAQAREVQIENLTKIADTRLQEQNQLRQKLGLPESAPWSQVLDSAGGEYTPVIDQLFKRK